MLQKFLLVLLMGSIAILAIYEVNGKRLRRDTRANERLAKINSEFHLYDSPPLQRLVRQTANVNVEVDAPIPNLGGPTTPKATTTTTTPPSTKASTVPTETNDKTTTVSRKPKPKTNSSSSGTLVRPQLPRRPPPRPPVNQGELYLPPGYNRLEIPKLRIGRKVIPVPVIVYLNLRSIRDYDENEGTITLEMDLIVEWFDGLLFDITKVNPRVAPIQKTLNPVFLEKIWTPDIYMNDLVKVEQPAFMAKPLTLKFSPNTGFISYTSRLAVKASCGMYFYYYPAETQVCEFHLKSYSFYTSDLELNWLLHGVYLQDPEEPNFDIQVSSIDTIRTIQPFNNPKNESHDTLVFTILARRKISYHMVQTYLPSIFFIIITWLCFLIPSKFIEARIGISMTTLLTLTAMFASVRESTPIVSYVKAIDLWMVFCIFFVFLTLLEFSVLIWMRSVREDAEENKADQIEVKNGHGSGGRGKPSDNMSQISTISSQLRQHEFISEFVEKYAFLIFSIIFIVFNIIYWSWLLQAAGYLEWKVNATHTFIEGDD